MQINPNTMNVVQPQMLSVADIFDNVHYVVPIYQRNYAWEKDQIEQLLQDILDITDDYYLGNLIVNKSGNNFEVIDGQQRLTTLYLMMLCLKKSVAEDALTFEARDKSNDTFKKMRTGAPSSEWLSTELNTGYDIIENFFKSKMKDSAAYDNFYEKLSKIKIARVQVPEGIDLNHYFEIMNTRGEQLTPHEIVKARILAVVKKAYGISAEGAAAKIWDACALMDSYVQMNFDTESRRKLFSEDWTGFNCDSFESAAAKCTSTIKFEEDDVTFKLVEFLKGGAVLKDGDKLKNDSKDEQERFESVISFPNFLLHVNAVISGSNSSNLDSLDDKKFLDSLKVYWENSEKAKTFIFTLLKCRYLLDKYIIKREFYKDYREEGRWMLQGIKAYQDKKKDSLKPQYFGTYNTQTDVDSESIEDKTRFDTDKTKRIRMLESCLRITYTSPKMMHWITDVLLALYKNENVELIPLLETYCRTKVQESNYENASGFGIERIVFTYLDYLLWRDGFSYNGSPVISTMENYQYQYRNSIEHFSPQHPAERKPWDDDDLNSFGNLALVTVSGNSKFSNNEPVGKISSFGSVVEQSLKLKVMAAMTKSNNGDWTQEMAAIHKKNMFTIIVNDLKSNL